MADGRDNMRFLCRDSPVQVLSVLIPRPFHDAMPNPSWLRCTEVMAMCAGQAIQSKCMQWLRSSVKLLREHLHIFYYKPLSPPSVCHYSTVQIALAANHLTHFHCVLVESRGGRRSRGRRENREFKWSQVEFDWTAQLLIDGVVKTSELD